MRSSARLTSACLWSSVSPSNAGRRGDGGVGLTSNLGVFGSSFGSAGLPRKQLGLISPSRGAEPEKRTRSHPKQLDRLCEKKRARRRKQKQWYLLAESSLTR